MAEANFIYKTVPYKHQVDAVHYCYGKEFFALLMEQGTGKSKTLIDIVSNLYLEKKIEAVMLIAPNGVQEQWAQEQIPTHSPVPFTDYTWRLSTSVKQHKEVEKFVFSASPGLKWFCINVEAFSRDTHLSLFKSFLKYNKTFLVVDEATRIKNPHAQRTINIIQGLSVLTQVGRRITSISPLSIYRAILTGTMVTNNPYDIWSMMEFLQHNYLGLDFYSFKNRYGIEKRMSIPGSSKSYTRKVTTKEIDSVRHYANAGKSVEEIANIMALSESSVRFIKDNPSVRVPYKNLEELKNKIAPISFIIRKVDCLDLPPKIYEKIYTELSAEQKRTYKELVNHLYTEYAHTELSVVSKLTLLGRLSQITGGFLPGELNEEKVLIPFEENPKLDALIDDLKECADWPVIVVAAYIAEIHAIYERLVKEYPDDRIEYICGEIKNNRSDLIESFKRGEIKILVVNARTVGSGYNLQICHVQYFYSNTYSMEDRAQIEDRIHRDGQKADTVVYKDIIAKSTVDEKVFLILQQKKDLLEYMRDKTIGEFLGD